MLFLYIEIISTPTLTAATEHIIAVKPLLSSLPKYSITADRLMTYILTDIVRLMTFLRKALKNSRDGSILFIPILYHYLGRLTVVWYDEYMNGNNNKLDLYFFSSRTEIDKNGCWLWKLSRTHKGYASATYESRTRVGHRLSYEYFKGEIPEGLEVDHLCSVRHCVNPDHLEAVSHLENIRRGSIANKTHCVKGHPLSGSNLKPKKHRNGKIHRSCKICYKAHCRRGKAKYRGKPIPSIEESIKYCEKLYPIRLE